MADIPSHVRTVINGDGCVILNSRTGTITTLNSTGAFIWGALQRREDISTIINELVRESGASTSDIESDVRHFLDAIRKEHLLRD